MNKKFYKMNLITLSFLMMSSAHAYKIIFYTDEVSQKKAQEVLQTFKKTYPLSKLNIEYEIIKL